MALMLFAAICVRDCAAARPWYERVLGGEPTFVPNATEAVWDLAENRSVYIREDPERAGRSVVSIFVDDLDAQVASIAAHGNRAHVPRHLQQRRAKGHLPRRRRQRGRLRRHA